MVLRDLPVFHVDLQVLVFGKRVVLGEVAHRLTQTDFVVERRGLDDLLVRCGVGGGGGGGLSLTRVVVLVSLASLCLHLTVLDGDALEELVGGVLENDELVTDDAPDDFLFLFGVDLVAAFGFVHLLDAAAGASAFSVEDFVDVDRLRAALELVRRAERTVQAGFHFALLFVEAAVAHFGDRVKLLAPLALEDVQVRPHLPVDLLPRDTVSLTNESDELLQVPRAVDDVFGADLSGVVDHGAALRAREHLALALGEQLLAVGALVQVVLFFFKEQLELLHEQPTDQFVFALLQTVKSIQTHFLGHLSYNL